MWFAVAAAVMAAMAAATTQIQANRQAEAQAAGIEHAQAAEQEAQATEADESRRRLRRVLASQRAYFGAAGLSSGEGSAAAASVGAAREAAIGTTASNNLARRRLDAMAVNRKSLLSGRMSPALAGGLGGGSSAVNSMLLYQRLEPGKTT